MSYHVNRRAADRLRDGSVGEADRDHVAERERKRLARRARLAQQGRKRTAGHAWREKEARG